MQFNNLKVIDGLNLEIHQGSITTILAPSGAGKTTLLRLIAGLESATEGKILVNGHEVREYNQGVGYIFQESSIFPWLTVEENIKFGLKLKANRNKNNQPDTNKLIDRICTDLQIENFKTSYPNQLSGGQKQRVAIARSLVLRPKVLLFDEPFSSLDESTRQNLREQLLELHSFYKPTIIFITHSIEEALFLGDQIFICSNRPIKLLHTYEARFNMNRNHDIIDSSEFLAHKLNIKKIISSTYE